MKDVVVVMGLSFALVGCLEDSGARADLAALEKKVSDLEIKIGRNQFIDTDPKLSFRVSDVDLKAGKYSNELSFSYVATQGNTAEIGRYLAQVEFAVKAADGRRVGKLYEMIKVSDGVSAGSVTSMGSYSPEAEIVEAVSYKWWLDNTVSVTESLME